MKGKREVRINWFLSLAISLAFTFLAFFSTPWSWAQPPREGGTLIYGEYREPSHIDCRIQVFSAADPVALVYDNLAEYGEKLGEMVPMLAERWTQTDPLTYRIHIRKGVKFHNGRELTAEDVKKHFDWWFATPTGWRPSVGRRYATYLNKVELIDRYTLQISLKRSIGTFEPLILREGNTGICLPEALEKWGNQISFNAVGTGPFKFVEWVSGDHVTFERFDDYWAKKPYLERVIYRILPDEETRLLALQKGEVDIAWLNATAKPAIDKSPQLRFYSQPAPYRPAGLWLNMRRWPMSELNFRKALAMGINWEEVAKKALPYGLGYPITSFLAGSWAQDPKAKGYSWPYDPVKAKELLKEVERKAGKPIPPLEIMAPAGSEHNVPPAIMTRMELMKIGLETKLRLLPAVQINARITRDRRQNWDIASYSMRGLPGDPGLVMGNFHSTKFAEGADGKNRMAYFNPKVDELTDKAEAITDRKMRTNLYREVDKIINQEIPAIPIQSVIYFWGVKDTVIDFKPHPSIYVYVTSPWNNIWKQK